jgi:hypothetical protein
MLLFLGHLIDGVAWFLSKEGIVRFVDLIPDSTHYYCPSFFISIVFNKQNILLQYLRCQILACFIWPFLLAVQVEYS